VLLTIPTSDVYTEVKISVIDAEGNELSSECTNHKTVEISDAHWNSDELSIVSQFVGPSGKPDPACPLEFLKKGKSHETPKTQAAEPADEPTTSLAPAVKIEFVDTVEHEAAVEPVPASECGDGEAVGEPQAADIHQEVKPFVMKSVGLPVKRNKR